MHNQVMMNKEIYIDLLKNMIALPSYSGKEEKTAKLLATYFSDKGYLVNRFYNNVWVFNYYFDTEKPTLLLCSHHDTVQEKGYSIDPFNPIVKEGKLYGLGSNDAGASVVSLIATFDHFYFANKMKYNLCLLLSAEEEIGGEKGIRAISPLLPTIDLAIIGEPTKMDVAIAERGLMVLDCQTTGVSGHAAHPNTINPIYLALDDLNWLASYRFPKVSDLLGEVKMSVTIIAAGSQHNVVPDKCCFTIDVRSNGCYTNEEILAIIQAHLKSKVTPRSTRLSSSQIAATHPLVEQCQKNGAKTFGSTTLSDQALLTCPSVKMGVGDSMRSHTANEYVELQEIEDGIDRYVTILDGYLLAE